MAGRHREITDSTPSTTPIGTVAAASALAVLLVGVGGWAVVAAVSDECDRLRLSVAASPDIAPAVRDVASRFNESEHKVNRFCVQVAVAAQESWRTAGILAGDPSAGTEPPPNVWIPEHSLWVDQARANAQGPSAIPAGGTSIASSPTVIAVTRPVAAKLAGTGEVGWVRMMKELNSDQPLSVGFPNPTRNATGLATLLSVAKVVASSPEARARQVSLVRALSDGAADSPAELFAKLPQQADPATLASSVAALPATEQSVWKYNSGRPAVPLVAVYPVEGALRLDYPYVIAGAGKDEVRARAAEAFLAELQKDAGRKALMSNGFRSPDGQASGAVSPALGLNPRPPKDAAKPPARAVAAAMKSWRAVSASARLLVLVDISGSMITKVPAVKKSRIEVTLSAAQQGLGLFGDSTEIGLWTFSSQLVGAKQDYRELVPVGPLSQPVGDAIRRGALANALAQITAKKGGETGLYDSVMAAYQAQRASYTPNKVNSVVVFTDGKNNDPSGGLSLSQLLAQLKQLSDPKRPLPVFIIAFGRQTDVDMPTMRKIAAVTRGAAYNANTPAEINKVFLDAVGLRTCRPDC